MEPDDDLRTLIGERAREIDVPAPNPRAVRIRARRFRVRRYAAGGSLALLLAVGVVVPLRALGALGGRGPARVVSESPVPGQLPDAAKILCDGSTTQLLTPEVRPQPDGVHFEVENSSGRALGFQVRDGGGSDAAAGTSEPADPGTGSPGWTIAPGAAGIESPGEDWTRLLAHSPVRDIHRNEAPLLLLQAENDHRCPPGQSEVAFTILRRLGRRVELVRYPDESHLLFAAGRPDRRVDRLERIVDWFARYL
jgi:hypothetical protein